MLVLLKMGRREVLPIRVVVAEGGDEWVLVSEEEVGEVGGGEEEDGEDEKGYMDEE